MRPRTPAKHASQPTRADGLAWPAARASEAPMAETRAERLHALAIGAIASARALVGLTPLSRGRREEAGLSPRTLAAIKAGRPFDGVRACESRQLRRTVRAHLALAVVELGHAGQDAIDAYNAARRLPCGERPLAVPAAQGAGWRASTEADKADHAARSDYRTAYGRAMAERDAARVGPWSREAAPMADARPLAVRAADMADVKANRASRRLADRVRWLADESARVPVPCGPSALASTLRLALCALRAQAVVESLPGRVPVVAATRTFVPARI